VHRLHIATHFLALSLLAWPSGAFAQQVSPAAASPRVSGTPAVAAQVPHLVKFSGAVKNANGKPLSTVAGITFALYQDQEGGTPLWTETQNVQPDAAGRYTVWLGATRNEGVPVELFASGQARWLGVQVEGQPEQPRVLLAAVPYALKAADAETVGGLPPSAFLLAPPGAAGPDIAQPTTVGQRDATPAASTGTQNYIPLWTDSAGDLGNSVLYQSGAGTTAKIGVNNTTPAATLDVKGAGIVRGTLSLPTTAAATATAGKTSQPLSLAASAFNIATNTAVPQTFHLQAEPAGNDTATPSGVLSLLYGSGTSTPAETGFSVASNGVINFAPAQTFPGAGSITAVTAGTGLSGGGTSGAVTLSNTGLLGIVAGTGISSSSGQTPTIGINTSAVPQLAAANTFTGNQTVNGNVSATGLLSGTAFNIGSNLFAWGSNANGNAFVGFAGNPANTGQYNTGSGVGALGANTTGGANTGVGSFALQFNTTGANNTAVGAWALEANTTGSYNTAVGQWALPTNTTGGDNTATGADALGSNTTASDNTADGAAALSSNTTGGLNTAVGTAALYANTAGGSNTAVGNSALYYNTTGSGITALGNSAGPDSNSTNLSNATAIGANAVVSENNALVLGCISGVNNCVAAVNVGIGTATPAYSLDVHGTGNFTGAVRFAPGQTFPGAGTGTVSSVASGAGLTGGPITTSGTLSIATGGVSNTMLANPSLTVAAGTDLIGGGAVPLGGSTTLNLDTTKVPQLNLANTFTGNQTVNGNLSSTGTVTGASFGIGSNLFAFGSYSNVNAFLGFSGNTTTTGVNNTAVGVGALAAITSGGGNTAIGAGAMTGSAGTGNIAIGYLAGQGIGNYNIDIGNWGVTDESGVIRIGTACTLGPYNCQVATLIAGIRGVTTGYPDAVPVLIDSSGQLGTVSSSRRYKEDIQDMGDTSSGLLRLRPVTFRYKKPFSDGSQPIQYGLIAEEVAEVYPDLVARSADGQIETVKYQLLDSMLLNELQKQNATIATLKEQIAAQEQQNRSLEERLAKVEAALSGTTVTAPR